MNDESSVTVGLLAPEFSLPSGNGTEISLGNFRSKKNVALFFIREYY